MFISYKDLFDPKNSLWLEVVRIVGIAINGLLVLMGFIALILGHINFWLFLLLLPLIAFLHLVNMLSLNALYNLQKLRSTEEISLTIQREILDEIVKKNNQ